MRGALPKLTAARPWCVTRSPSWTRKVNVGFNERDAALPAGIAPVLWAMVEASGASCAVAKSGATGSACSLSYRKNCSRCIGVVIRTPSCTSPTLLRRAPVPDEDGGRTTAASCWLGSLDRRTLCRLLPRSMTPCVLVGVEPSGAGVGTEPSDSGLTTRATDTRRASGTAAWEDGAADGGDVAGAADAGAGAAPLPSPPLVAA